MIAVFTVVFHLFNTSSHSKLNVRSVSDVQFTSPTLTHASLMRSEKSVAQHGCKHRQPIHPLWLSVTQSQRILLLSQVNILSH